MKALFLAAGLGTRFRPHTLQLPKPAIPLLNVPLLTYNIEHFSKVEKPSWIVNTFHLPRKIHALFEKELKIYKGQTSFSDEKDFIRGSGGGVKHCEKFFGDDEHFFYINADEVFLPEDPLFLQKALDEHRRSKRIATLITSHHPEVGHRFGGVWTDPAGSILDIGKKKPDDSQQGHHFIGYQIFSRRIFKYLKDTQENNIFTDGLIPALRDGESAAVYPVKGDWFEIGDLNSYLDCTHRCLQLLQNKKSSWLSAFLKKWAPDCELVTAGSQLIWKPQRYSIESNQVQSFAVLGHDVTWTQKWILNASVVTSGAIINHHLQRELILNLS